MLQNIAEFPEPKDITGVRSWLKIIYQVYGPHNDWSIMEPLRSITKPAKTGEKWANRWGQEQTTAFENSRTKIMEHIKDDQTLPLPPGGKNQTTKSKTMHVMAMKSGELRKVVEFQKMIMAVPPNSTKTVLDAWNGYHSMPLEENLHLTTFLTQRGIYKYCNLPQGHMAAGDTYTARYNEINQGFKCIERCVDDTILWDYNLEENLKATELITK